MRRLLLIAALCVACTQPKSALPPGVHPERSEGPSRPPAPASQPAPILPQRLRVIGTNDFHGALEPRPDENNVMRGGAAYFAAKIRQAERECQQPECVSILVDGGDEFQGTPASNLVFGRTVVEIFNYLGYAAAAVGNHEFDWSQDTLRARMRDAHYAILGANVKMKANGWDAAWIPNDTIVQRGPFKVGIIGLATTETPTTTMGTMVADLDFVDQVAIIDSIAPVLRARGADFVIVVGHIGARCNADGTCAGEAANIANRITTKVDAVISGHSHTRVDGAVKGIPLMQARSRGWAIDVVDLYTSGAPAQHEVRDVITDSIAPNADVAQIVTNAKAHIDRIAPHVNRPVATIAASMRNTGNQHPVGNLVADAMRVVGGGDLAIMNNGGVRQSLFAGVATYGTLYEIQPFGNTLIRVRVTGQNLLTYFAQNVAQGVNFHLSGARLVYHATPTLGLDSLLVQGSPVSPQTVYTVILNNFMADGGDHLGFGSLAISTTPTGTVDLDALVAYLSSLPQPVQPPTDARVIRRP